MDSVAYYIVASVVRDTLAVIIVMIFALDLIEFAVLDENPGRFAEQSFEGFSHLTRSVCALGLKHWKGLLYLKGGLYTQNHVDCMG